MAASDGGVWTVRILGFPWTVTATREEIVFEGRGRIAVSPQELIGAVRTQNQVSVCYFHPTQRAFKRLEVLCDSSTVSGEIEEYVRKAAKVGSEERSLAVLVNPIGGRKRGRRYWAKLIEPILRYSQCKYRLFETTSTRYVEDFCSKLNITEFTDIVCVGGDGLLHQLMNGLARRTDAEKALRVRIGIVPAGSQNALACAIGCKNPVLSLYHILKQHSFPGRLLSISLDSSPTPILSCCGLAWGIVSSIARRAQSLRKFGAAVSVHPALRRVRLRAVPVSMEDLLRPSGGAQSGRRGLADCERPVHAGHVDEA